MKRIPASVVCLATITIAGLFASAQNATTQSGDWDQWIQQAKNPIDWFSWGGDLRLRNEYFDNALTLNGWDNPATHATEAAHHEQDYFRFRGRVWASVLPLTNVSVNVRLAAEPRDFMEPSFCSTYANQSGVEWRYGIIDNLNAKWANVLGSPLTLSAGRQDVQFGEPLNWWLVADGTPFDGSWTMFLDSIRAAYEAREINTRVDLVYIYQNALPDAWIPTIGKSADNVADFSPPAHKPYYLTEQNEQGAIFYLANKSIKNTEVDGYFIYKHDSQEGSILSPYKTAAGVPIPLGDSGEIYTVGGRVSGNPADHWKYSAEGAYQFGHKDDPMLVHDILGRSENRDIDAFGVNANLTYLFKDKLNNQASLVFEYLSGDDPKTGGKDEMFDVLWGRWPRWSELYIYSYVNETGTKIAQLNNIMRLGASWSLTPFRNTTFSATYNALLAPQDVPTRELSASLFSQTSNFRGHFLQTVLKHQFSKHVSGHLWGEMLWMGDYYTHRDLMAFARAEIMFTF